MLFLRRVPFAFCSLLLWHSLTRERVKGVLRHALNNPGSRPGKSPLRGPFALCRLPFGSGPSLHPCRPSPPPASLRAAPVSRQRLIDFHAGPTASLRFSAFQINSFRFEQQFRRPDKRSAIRHDITEFQTQLPDGGINTLSGLRCYKTTKTYSASASTNMPYGWISRKYCSPISGCRRVALTCNRISCPCHSTVTSYCGPI